MTKTILHKLGVDQRPLEPGFKAHANRGIGRYARKLLENLWPLAADFASLGIALSPFGSENLQLSAVQKKFVELAPCGKQTLQNQFLSGYKLKQLGFTAVHYFSHGDAPILFAPPAIVSVLDLIPLRFPELYAAKENSWRFRFARYLENRVAVSALGILAISEHTKRDVCELLGIASEKVFVTPLAVDEFFSPAPSLVERQQARQQLCRRMDGFGLDISASQPLLLYVGGIDPRKNLTLFLRALKELSDNAKQGSRPQPLLLIAGGEIEGDAHFPELKCLIKELSLERNVAILGYVSDDDLVNMYRLSDIFVFPSLYEGFGLPVLEAMACGCPVVLGRNSCLPEVAGQAGFFVDETSISSWVEQIILILEDADRRVEMIERGLKQAALFSWSKTAQLTFQAWKEILTKSPLDFKI